MRYNAIAFIQVIYFIMFVVKIVLLM